MLRFSICLNFEIVLQTKSSICLNFKILTSVNILLCDPRKKPKNFQRVITSSLEFTSTLENKIKVYCSTTNRHTMWDCHTTSLKFQPTAPKLIEHASLVTAPPQDILSHKNPAQTMGLLHNNPSEQYKYPHTHQIKGTRFLHEKILFLSYILNPSLLKSTFLVLSNFQKNSRVDS